MTPDELLKTMRAALADERDGIRRLDIATIARAGATKERIIEAIRTSAPTEQASLRAALKELAGELLRNLVLLAHARDYVRDAIDLCGAPGGRPRLQAKL